MSTYFRHAHIDHSPLTIHHSELTIPIDNSRLTNHWLLTVASRFF
jgi:hypothetical protein